MVPEVSIRCSVRMALHHAQALPPSRTSVPASRDRSVLHLRQPVGDRSRPYDGRTDSRLCGMRAPLDYSEAELSPEQVRQLSRLRPHTDLQHAWRDHPPRHALDIAT